MITFKQQDDSYFSIPGFKIETLKQHLNLKPSSSQVKSSQVCFIVSSSTCTVHTYRELKLRYSLTLGAYS